MSSEDRSFDPTPRHRQEMRKKGEVALSRDLVSASILLAGMLLFWGFGGILAEISVQNIQESWNSSAWLKMSPESFLKQWNTWLHTALFGVVPILMLGPITAALVSLIQTQFLFLPSKLAPNWKYIHPGKGIQRIFSLDSLTATGFGLAKIAFVAVFLVWMVLGQIPVLAAMYRLEFGEAIREMQNIVFGTGLKIAATLFFLALADYAWQFYRHQQRLKMTYEEMKEEIRISEGDSSVKQRMRERRNQETN